MSASLENRRPREVAARAVAPAEAAVLAERLARALESIATELAQIRAALEQPASSQHDPAHAVSGPWLRKHPPAGLQ